MKYKIIHINIQLFSYSVIFVYNINHNNINIVDENIILTGLYTENIPVKPNLSDLHATLAKIKTLLIFMILHLKTINSKKKRRKY